MTCCTWGTPAAEPFAAGFRAVFENGLAEYDSRRRPTFRVVAGNRVEDGDSWEKARDVYESLLWQQMSALSVASHLQRSISSSRCTVRNSCSTAIPHC